MPNFRASRLDQAFLQDQSALRTVPNSSGTATLAIANYVRYMEGSITARVPTIKRADRTGTLTGTAGSKSVESAAWSLKGSLAAGSTQGATPPYGPILKAAFGQGPTSVTGSGSVTNATNASPIVITQTGHGKADGDCVYISAVGGNTAANGVWIIANSTTNTYELIGSTGNGAYTSGGTASFVAKKYTLSDSVLSFVFALFNSGTGIKDFLAYGCIPERLKWEFGGLRNAMFDASGSAICALDSDTFSSVSTVGQAGLTSFPSQPTGSLPADSGAITAFRGALIINGASHDCIDSAAIEWQTGRQFAEPPCLNEDYYDRVKSDERVITGSLNIIDSDAAAALDLYAKSKDKALFDVHLRMGRTAPGVYMALLKNCQAEHTGADTNSTEARRSYTVTPVGTGNNDELTLWVF